MLNKKGSMLPLPYETLLKVIIALVFIILIVVIIAVVILAIFGGEDVDYGSFKSYDILVRKINELDCGSEESCLDYHYLYLNGKNDILFFNETYSTSFSNLASSSIRCGYDSDWFSYSGFLPEEKPKVCGDSSCACFNGECFEESKLENVNLGFNSYESNIGRSYELFFNLETELYLFDPTPTDYLPDTESHTDNRLLLPLDRLSHLPDSGSLVVNNCNSVCKADSLLYVKLTIQKIDDKLYLHLSDSDTVNKFEARGFEGC